VRRARAASRAAAGAAASVSVLLALLLPARHGALEPRFDHRDQQGPTAEALVVRDTFWHGSGDTESAVRGAVRVAWGFDPAGDGDELFFGATLTVLEREPIPDDRVRLSVDARYRACVGSEELKTLLDFGIWATASDRIAVGPLVGIGFIYDFSREFGLLTSFQLGAAFGQTRVLSVGGGVGLQYRFE